MDLNRKVRFVLKNIYIDKYIVSPMVKAVVACFLVAVYSFIEIYFNGFTYKNILLFGGSVFAVFAIIIYGVFVTQGKDKKQEGRLRNAISFCGYFSNVFGFYLIFYEGVLSIKLLLKEFYLQTALTGLFFLSAGLIIINGIGRITKIQKNTDKKEFSLNWFFAFIMVLFAFPRLIGGMSSLGNTFRLEVPFVLFWYWYFCVIQRKNSLQPYWAAIPILLIYILFDLYYIAFGKIFKVVDIKEIPELINVLPFPYVAISVIAIVIPVCLYLLFIDYRKYKHIFAGIAVVFWLGFTIKYTPDTFLKLFKYTAKNVTDWSDKKNVENNGRFMMLLYSEAKRNLGIKKTVLFRNRGEYIKEINKTLNYLNVNSIKRNIHLVVLESFMDPTLFKNIKFSKEPVYQEFSSFFQGKEGFSISPVFGGQTAQSEFEILSGIPALDNLDSVEFNLFTGVDAYGLPGILRGIGYRTIASNSYKPDYFNAVPAYKGLGFSEIYFPHEYTSGTDTYLSTGDVTDEDMMFDGRLFEQNVKFISKIIEKTPNQPVFNYLVGTYGHYPFKLNKNKHPELISIDSKINTEELKRQVNQFYYRTEAVIKYVKGLIKIDPNGIIILVSDHLPFFINQDEYKIFNYLENVENANKYNRIYIVVNGKPVKNEVIFHHDIPNLIMNYLTEGKYLLENHYDFGLREIDKSRYYEKYMKFMAHAIK